MILDVERILIVMRWFALRGFGGSACVVGLLALVGLMFCGEADAQTESESDVRQVPESQSPPAVEPETAGEPAESTNGPSASPSPGLQASPAEAAAAKPMSRRQLIDAMSMADLQEAIRQIRENSIRSPQIDDLELSRALFEGLLTRLGPGADLLLQDQTSNETGEAKPFFAEILDGRIGYVRLGTLGESTMVSLDAALANFVASGLGSLILDLRTSSGGSLEQAVGVAKRFTPNGSLIFTVRRPGEKQERIFTNGQDPGFRGLLMVAVDKGTSGPAEIVAETLRASARAMIIGERTAGRAVEYSDLKLKGGQVLRLAVAEVVIPDRSPIFPDGVSPDIEVVLPESERAEILEKSVEHGVSQFVFDKERPRLNEAALLAGETPELDSFKEMQRSGNRRERVLRDAVLQRAVDLISTISIYERKPGAR